MFNHKHSTLKAGWGDDSGMAVQFQLAIIDFQDENGVFFSYIPSLDVTGYGRTQQEAEESLKIVLHEYLCYTTENKTLLKDLEKHGWVIKRKKKKMNPPDLATLIRKNEELNSIFTTKDFSKKNESIGLPAFA